MLEFFNKHPLIALAVGVIVVFVIMFVTVKVPKKKPKSKDSVSEKKETKPDDNQKETGETKVVEPEPEAKSDFEQSGDELPEEKNVILKQKKVKKTKEKPVVVPVFKKVSSEKQTDEESDNGDSDSVEQDLQKRAEFVNSSKKISKFAGLKDINEMHENDCPEDSKEEELLQGYDENCEVCKEIACHFDHSRRLSKFIKEGSFDDMFASHISDHYLNIDSGRHLKLDDIDKQLYDRTLKTLSNSETKVLAAGDGEKPTERLKNDKDFMKSWLEEKRREEYAKMLTADKQSDNDERTYREDDDLKLSAKNLMIAGAILQRKNKKHRK